MTGEIGDRGGGINGSGDVSKSEEDSELSKMVFLRSVPSTIRPYKTSGSHSAACFSSLSFINARSFTSVVLRWNCSKLRISSGYFFS